MAEIVSLGSEFASQTCRVPLVRAVRFGANGQEFDSPMIQLTRSGTAWRPAVTKVHVALGIPEFSRPECPAIAFRGPLTRHAKIMLES